MPRRLSLYVCIRGSIGIPTAKVGAGTRDDRQCKFPVPTGLGRVKSLPIGLVNRQYLLVPLASHMRGFSARASLPHVA